MKGRYKGEALLTAREVSLWFLTSGTGAWAPLVGLSLLQRPEAPEAGWVLPTLVSASQVSDTADFAVVSIVLQEQGICGGAGLWWVHRGCLCEEAGAHVLHSSFHFPAQF